MGVSEKGKTEEQSPSKNIQFRPSEGEDLASQLQAFTPEDGDIIISRFREIVKTKTHHHHLKTYKYTFDGKVAVAAMISNGLANDVEHALELGNWLLDKDVIHHIHQRYGFKNEHLFYRYTDEATMHHLLEKKRKPRHFFGKRPKKHGASFTSKTGLHAHVYDDNGKRLFGKTAEDYLATHTRDLPWEKSVLVWVEQVIEEKLASVDDIWLSLKSGIALCKLLNKLIPGSCPDFKTDDLVPLQELSNISYYLDVCWSLGLPSDEVFTSADLYHKKNLPQVYQNVYALALFAPSLGWEGVLMEASATRKTERELTDLRKKVSSLLLENAHLKNTNCFSATRGGSKSEVKNMKEKQREDDRLIIQLKDRTKALTNTNEDQSQQIQFLLVDLQLALDQSTDNTLGDNLLEGLKNDLTEMQSKMQEERDAKETALRQLKQRDEELVKLKARLAKVEEQVPRASHSRAELGKMDKLIKTHKKKSLEVQFHEDTSESEHEHEHDHEHDEEMKEFLAKENDEESDTEDAKAVIEELEEAMERTSIDEIEDAMEEVIVEATEEEDNLQVDQAKETDPVNPAADATESPPAPFVPPPMARQQSMLSTITNDQLEGAKAKVGQHKSTTKKVRAHRRKTSSRGVQPLLTRKIALARKDQSQIAVGVFTDKFSSALSEFSNHEIMSLIDDLFSDKDVTLERVHTFKGTMLKTEQLRRKFVTLVQNRAMVKNARVSKFSEKNFKCLLYVLNGALIVDGEACTEVLTAIAIMNLAPTVCVEHESKGNIHYLTLQSCLKHSFSQVPVKFWEEMFWRRVTSEFKVYERNHKKKMNKDEEHMFFVRVLSHYTYEMISWECGVDAVATFLTELPPLCEIEASEIKYLFDLLPADKQPEPDEFSESKAEGDSERSSISTASASLSGASTALNWLPGSPGRSSLSRADSGLSSNGRRRGSLASVADGDELPELPEDGGTPHGDGWLTSIDEETGKRYYFKRERGCTTWEDPLLPALPSLDEDEVAKQPGTETETPRRPKRLRPASGKSWSSESFAHGSLSSVGIIASRMHKEHGKTEKFFLIEVVVTKPLGGADSVDVERSLSQIREFDQEWRESFPQFLQRFPFPKEVFLKSGGFFSKMKKRDKMSSARRHALQVYFMGIMEEGVLRKKMHSFMDLPDDLNLMEPRKFRQHNS